MVPAEALQGILARSSDGGQSTKFYPPIFAYLMLENDLISTDLIVLPNWGVCATRELGE